LIEKTGCSGENYLHLEAKLPTSYLHCISRDDFAGFSAAEMLQIDEIAGICPLLGGNPVFSARSLQSTYKDRIYYDDKLICNEQGVYYRLAATDSAHQ